MLLNKLTMLKQTSGQINKKRKRKKGEQETANNRASIICKIK